LINSAAFKPAEMPNSFALLLMCTFKIIKI